MGYVRNVKNAIYDALDDYECEVSYTSGDENSSSYFTVTIYDEWDWEWIEEDINEVCDEYGLWIDDDSEGSFDLCVKN